MKRKTYGILGAIAVAVGLTLMSPSMASALTWTYFAGPYPTVDTQLKQNTPKNSSITTNAGGKGKLLSSGTSLTFKMSTVRANATQYVVGSGQTFSGVNLEYTHLSEGGTYVSCWWTYGVQISGSTAANCARGF